MALLPEEALSLFLIDLAFRMHKCSRDRYVSCSSETAEQILPHVPLGLMRRLHFAIGPRQSVRAGNRLRYRELVRRLEWNQRAVSWRSVSEICIWARRETSIRAVVWDGRIEAEAETYERLHRECHFDVIRVGLHENLYWNPLMRPLPSAHPVTGRTGEVPRWKTGLALRDQIQRDTVDHSPKYDWASDRCTSGTKRFYRLHTDYYACPVCGSSSCPGRSGS